MPYVMDLSLFLSSGFSQCLTTNVKILIAPIFKKHLWRKQCLWNTMFLNWSNLHLLLKWCQLQLSGAHIPLRAGLDLSSWKLFWWGNQTSLQAGLSFKHSALSVLTSITDRLECRLRNLAGLVPEYFALLNNQTHGNKSRYNALCLVICELWETTVYLSTRCFSAWN